MLCQRFWAKGKMKKKDDFYSNRHGCRLLSPINKALFIYRSIDRSIENESQLKNKSKIHGDD